MLLPLDSGGLDPPFPMDAWLGLPCNSSEFVSSVSFKAYSGCPFFMILEVSL